jgi:hypothetical protein
MYKCKICKYESQRNANLIRHEQSQSHINKVKEKEKKKQKTRKMGTKKTTRQINRCIQCKRNFAQKSSLTRHMNTQHGKKPDSTPSKSCTEIAPEKTSKKDTKSDTCSKYDVLLPTPTNFYQVNQNQCRYCNKVFKSLFGQTKHEKICSEAKMKETIKEYEDKINKIKMEKEQLVEMNKILADDRRRYAELSLTNSKTTSKTMSMLSYLVYNYENNPPLQEISTNQMKSIIHRKKPDNIGIVKIIFMYHKEKGLDKYVGDGIISTYKKSNAGQQSLHTTDSSRLNYIIMDIVGDNEEWIYDGGGVKINQRIIGPICQEISQLLYEYIQDKIDNNENIDYEESQIVHDIRDQIDDGKLQKRINAYIAPHFETIKNESFSSRKKKKVKKGGNKGIKKELNKIKYTKKSKNGTLEDLSLSPTIQEIE